MIKKITLALLLLATLATGNLRAQLTPPLPGTAKQSVLAGVSYNDKKMLSFHAGAAKQLLGNVYGIGGVTFGTTVPSKVTAVVKGAYLLKVMNSFAFGPLLGAGFDVSDNEPHDAQWYLINATGLWGALNLGNDIGVYAAGEYHASFSGDDTYLDGWDVHTGIAVAF